MLLNHHRFSALCFSIINSIDYKKTVSDGEMSSYSVTF